jgi:hypothetical protein
MRPRAVDLTWTTSTRTLDEVRRFGSTILADTLRRAGYRMTSQGPDEIVMVRPERSNPSLLLFSLWAYLLSTDRARQVVISFARTADGRGRMRVVGDVPTKVVAALGGLPQS